MKIIDNKGILTIHANIPNVYDFIPNKVYTVCFNKMTGFFLQESNDIEIKDGKIYGVHQEKVKKVLNTFDKFNRNFGIILSGDKGMGKSLFSKLLSIESNKKGFPVIMVQDYIPGIAQFISSITQEVMIMFDEFDKTFKENDNMNPQDELLTLIDGFDCGKKMFVITCNEIHRLSDYFINRTGRFHYHIRFDYPKANEVIEYMKDNLIDKNRDKEIDEIVNFSLKTKVNYDILRSIVFEMNNGYSFKEAISDLNILDTEGRYYDIIVEFNDNHTESFCKEIDMFSNEIEFEFYRRNRNNNNNVGDSVGDRNSIRLSESGSLKIKIQKTMLKTDYLNGILYVDNINEYNIRKITFTKREYNGNSSIRYTF